MLTQCYLFFKLTFVYFRVGSTDFLLKKAKNITYDFMQWVY